MVTKGNIPVFDSPEDLDKNKDAKYVGKNTPVIRELTVLNEEKDARIMRIVVRGGSLAGEKRRWTLASNLASRTKSVCPENTPRKCNQFAVHFCDESGCRCIDSGAAPDDEIGNMVIEGVATLGIGPVAFGGKLLLSSLKAVRLVPAAVTSAPTVFANTSINLTKHVASPQTLAKAEEFIVMNHKHSFDFARSLIGKFPLTQKLDVIEVSSINYYTGLGYADMNKALRLGDEVMLKKLQPVIEAASSGLTKMADHAFKGIVYRGAELSDDLSALYSVGARVTEKAFTSTTRSATRTFSGNTVFVIKSKSGRMIEELSSFKGEAEVLFPPGTVFKVLSRSIEGTKTKISLEQILP